MAYSNVNFPSKKALKEAVAAHKDGTGPAVRCFQPGLGKDLTSYTGSTSLEGPHYPKPHSWYASAQLVDGVVVSVK